MPSEKSSIVSFQPSRGCICSHISRVVVSQNDEILGRCSERRPIRLQGCRPSLIDKLADTYYVSRLSCGWRTMLCAARVSCAVLR